MLEELRDVSSFAIGVVGLLVGASWLVDDHVEARQLSSARTCSTAAETNCVVDREGIVVERNGDELVVAYDDRRRRATVDLRAGAGPAAGTRVVLRFWEREPVAVVAAETGRLYRTEKWPPRWNPFALGLIAVAALAGTPFVVELVQRERSAPRRST